VSAPPQATDSCVALRSNFFATAGYYSNIVVAFASFFSVRIGSCGFQIGQPLKKVRAWRYSSFSHFLDQCMGFFEPILHKGAGTNGFEHGPIGIFIG
jgi:hypothetical protein